MKRRAALYFTSLSVLALACSDAHVPVTPESGVAEMNGRAREAWWAPSSLLSVAHALAMAINHDTEARAAVRNVLRDSPWSGHRVTLRELITADGSEAIVGASARFLGVTAAAFRAWVDAQPPMDFLMPRRLHRATWRATPGVFIVTTLDPESDRYAVIEPDGRPRRRAGPLGPDQAYFLLHPAEPRLARTNRQPPGVGEVIQMTVDGKLGRDYRPGPAAGRGGAAAASGTSQLLPLSHSGSNVTYVDHIYSHRKDALADAIVEIELEVSFYNEYGQVVRDTTWRLDFEWEDEHVNPHTVLISEVIPDSSTHHIRIHAWELDGGLHGDDDDMGTRDFYWSDRDQERTIIQGGSSSLNLTLGWTRRAASVVTDVDLWPSSIEVDPDESRWVYARVYDQYGYRLSQSASWSIDDSDVATVTPDGPVRAIVTGERAGRTTTLRAEAAGIEGTGTVSVTSCIGDICPEFAPTVSATTTHDRN